MSPPTTFCCAPNTLGAPVLLKAENTLLQGMAMQSIIAAMAERNGPPAVDFDFVLVAGHFLARDENIFTYFEVSACRNKTLPDCQMSTSFPKMTFAWRYPLTQQRLEHHLNVQAVEVQARS